MIGFKSCGEPLDILLCSRVAKGHVLGYIGTALEMHGSAADDSKLEMCFVQDFQDFREFLHLTERCLFFSPRRMSKDRAIEAKELARSVGVRSKLA